MPGLNYFIGKSISSLIQNRINTSYKSLRFIPNGRFLTLDLKRTGEAIDTIFDVGANTGQTCIELVKTFPKANIYSFEPVKATFQKLKDNVVDHSNINCFNLALGDEDGKLEINLDEDPERNSLKNAAEAQSLIKEEIEVLTGTTFCARHFISSIDLLKMDTEGFEMEVLKGFGKTFLSDKVKFIYAETAFNRTDPCKIHYADLDAYLSECGFVTSGFYEFYRWGKAKLNIGFCNVLFVNKSVIN